MEIYFKVITYVLSALLGLCVGSFLNVVIYRVPEKMNLAKPASHCPKCGYQLKWYDNIPVVSYIILGGKCRNCKEHISFRYTFVEIINALLWVACVAVFWEKSIPYACLMAAVCSVSICIAFIDLEHMLIFDRFQIMLLVLGAASIPFDKDVVWYSHLIGFAAGFIVFFAFAKIGEKVFGREALGGGDVKLAAVMGLLLGWEKLILSVIIASVVGSIVLVILRRSRGDEKNTEYPFGPFLILGLDASLLLGNLIMEWYKGILFR